MFVPVSWLKQYVDIENIDIKTLEDRLIMSGSNTETVEKLAAGIQKIVVGKCLSRDQHPNADKLLVLKVDVGGEEPLQIVTGAQNVYEGHFIPVALHKSTLADGTVIKKGKLRGEVSQGMFCSLEELGFERKVIQKEYDNGIYLIPGEPTLGEEVVDVLGIKDEVIEFEITPNRPDCLSMIGMARETAATFELDVRMPDLSIQNEVGDVKAFAAIEIEDPDLCPRFAGRVVKDVVIQDSPVWMQMALMKAGMRPVSNIVDITNFVMLEYGQPIHPYDLDTLKGGKLIARRAKNDEILVTLDDQERKLTDDMLVIADGERTGGLAGIMGGAETEITANTKNILIEIANFNKTNIRKTSKDLGLRTEASARFEKGVSPAYCTQVLDRVCHLIEKLGAGTVVGGTIDVYPNQPEEIVIKARPERINGLLGTKLSTEEIMDILKRVYLDVTLEEGLLVCKVPDFRLDLKHEIDLVEEVARIYGYDVIEPTLPQGAEWGAKTNGQIIEDVAKDSLTASGANEIYTYSFVSPRSVDRIGLTEDSHMRRAVMLINPLGEEFSMMRTTLLPNMMEVLARNYKRNVESARAFEIGNIFIPREMPVKNLPIEKKVMALGAYGKEEDFFTVKGMVENLLADLGIQGVSYMREENNPTFHPGRCATLVLGNHILGTMGEVHPRVAAEYEIEDRCYLADIDYNILMQIARMDRYYSALPKYPASTRDIAILVSEKVESAQVMNLVKANGGDILEEVKLFDVYQGKQIQAGFKSMAYALTFRSKERTLTDEEVNKVYDQILEVLKTELKAELR